MKDYSLMSDFDINHSVLSSMKIDGRVFGKPHFADGSSVGIHNDIGDRYEWFDYCNNPSDAWPIIDSCGICVEFDLSEDGESRWCNASNVSKKISVKYQKNALRAAMIVYLMMKDEEK